MSIEFVSGGTQAGRNHGVLEEDGQAALAGGFLPQIFGRATFGEHANPRNPHPIRAATYFGSRHIEENAAV
ncbi:MAG TPA: hypothetical protein VN728_11045 [Stellaceae bacterium]|nr:hypothetical protein [Stellaceae bacterium]